MSDRPIYYFSNYTKGNGNGKSFSNALPISALGVSSYTTKSDEIINLSDGFEGRFEAGKSLSLSQNASSMSFTNVTLIGGCRNDGEIENGVYTAPYTYATVIGAGVYRSLTDFTDKNTPPTYEEYEKADPKAKRKIIFNGNCNVSNIQFINQCGIAPNEPVIKVNGKNNVFTLVKFQSLISDKYAIDFAGSTKTQLLSCTISYNYCDSYPYWDGKRWTSNGQYRGIMSAGMNVLTSNLQPYEYCIGNSYNRGIGVNINDTRPLTGDANDPYNFIDNWYKDDGDILRFENFGLNVWHQNKERHHVFLGSYCGIKYRNNQDDEFPISNCVDSFFQEWTEIARTTSSTFNTYFRLIGWGNHFTDDTYTTTDTDIFSGGFETDPNDPAKITKYLGEKGKFNTTTYTITKTISSVLQKVNKPLNKHSYLLYNNARPYVDIYKLDNNKINDFRNNSKNRNKFIGKFTINNTDVYYTYNVFGTNERNWSYDNIKDYLDTNPDNYKDIDPFYDPVKYKTKYNCGILYENMINFIKNHPECIVGGVICNVDAFNRINTSSRYFKLEDIKYEKDGDVVRYNYDKYGNLNLDIAPRALMIHGGLYDSKNWTPTDGYGYTTPFNTPQWNYYTWNGVRGTPFYTVGLIAPVNTSLIQYEYNQYYSYIMQNGGDSGYITNNITVPDRLIYDGDFSVGNIKCNKNSTHKYSVLTLGRGQLANSSAPVYRGAKNAFIFDNNQLIYADNTYTNYKTSTNFWPAIITTSTYKKYHIAPIYGSDSNKTMAALTTSSRYYCEQVEGWFGYNPIEYGWMFIINNPQINSITFGEISSFNLIDSVYIPSTAKDMITMFECMTLDKDGKPIYNTIHSSIFIKDIKPSNSKSFRLRMSNLDISKYNMITLKNTSYLTNMIVAVVSGIDVTDLTSSKIGFTYPTYAHNANVYERFIIHPYLQKIDVDVYDESIKTFTPATRISVWGTTINNDTFIRNITSIINDNNKNNCTISFDLTCETENGKADFETNLVSALSCYECSINGNLITS